jgi:hypothetical protein
MKQSQESSKGSHFGIENFVLRILVMGSKQSERPSIGTCGVKQMVCTEINRLKTGKAIKY